MSLDLSTIALSVAARPHRSMAQSKRGWQQHVLATTAKPPVLSLKDYQGRPPSQRAQYDQARSAFHQGLDQIQTEQMVSAFDTMDRHAAALVADSTIARPGVILSGEANAGKSTILTSWGRNAELSFREAHGLQLPPDLSHAPRLDSNAEYLPVCYFNLTDSVGGSLRNALRFYLPALPGKRLSIDAYLHLLASFVNECRTSVILMDQMHEIKQASRGPAEVSEAIKQIMDTCPSTVLFGAGIGLEHLKIFSDGNSVGDARLGQTGGRFALHPVRAYDRYDPKSMQAWDRLLHTLDSELILLKAEPGDLLALSDYILDRTEGLTGAVMKLLRTAANDAISSGEERITRKVLGRVQVSAFADISSGFIIPTTRPGPVAPEPKPRGRSRKASNHISSSPVAVA